MKVVRTGRVVPVIVCSILLAAGWACRGRARENGPAKAGMPSSLRPLSFSQVSFAGE